MRIKQIYFSWLFPKVTDLFKNTELCVRYTSSCMLNLMCIALKIAEISAFIPSKTRLNQLRLADIYIYIAIYIHYEVCHAHFGLSHSSLENLLALNRSSNLMFSILYASFVDEILAGSCLGLRNAMKLRYSSWLKLSWACNLFCVRLFLSLLLCLSRCEKFRAKNENGQKPNRKLWKDRAVTGYSSVKVLSRKKSD